jgi:hypothetical protein
VQDTEKKKELKALYPYDPERQFFELWKFNDPGIPVDTSLKRLQQWCAQGSYNYPKKPWTEYLKEIGAYNLSEDLIVKAMKNYHEDHDKYPVQLSGDASKYIGFKINWNAINNCLKKGCRGLPGGSSLFKLRQEYFTGKESPLTEDIIVKAMKEYHEDHDKYPSSESGDASKYLKFKITWSAIGACLRKGLRGLPGDSSLAQLRKKYDIGVKPDLTEEQIIKAMRGYFEEHGRYPSLRGGCASKYIFEDILWSGIDASLRHGHRGLPGGSSLHKLKNERSFKHSLAKEDIAMAMKAYHEDHNKYPSKESGDASKYFGFKITWEAIDHLLRRGVSGGHKGSSVAKLKKHYRFGCLTEELIIKAITEYHGECERYPSCLSGDASTYFGFKTTWRNINERLNRGDRSLSKASSLAKLKKKYDLK